MKSAIKEAVALAERISLPNLNAHNRKIGQTQGQIDHTKTLLEGLLGVEDEARRILQSRLSEAYNLHRSLTSEGEQLRRLKEIGSTYQRLSLEPLTWRNADGFPRLVVFTLTSSLSRMVVMPGNIFSVEPGLPQNIAKQYQDVLRFLATKREKRKGVELTCRFEGLVPSEVKQKIKEARDTFGSQIFIVAEPGRLTLNAITPLPKGDPLIVGYDPTADANSLWLIADFDTTPVEDAMKFSLIGKASKN